MSGDHGDIPNNMKVFMTIFNRVGFPVIVCMWLAYQQFVSGKETVSALQEFKDVLIQVKDTLEQQNRILRHHGKDD